MAQHFDEKAGVVECPTPWGSWHQTMDEVGVLFNLPKGTKGKEVKVKIEVRMGGHVWTCDVVGFVKNRSTERLVRVG